MGNRDFACCFEKKNRGLREIVEQLRYMDGRPGTLAEIGLKIPEVQSIEIAGPEALVAADKYPLVQEDQGLVDAAKY